MIRELRAVVIGPVWQEVLSGISGPRKFEVVRKHLAAFDDLSIGPADYEESARYFKACRIQGAMAGGISFCILHSDFCILTFDFCDF